MLFVIDFPLSRKHGRPCVHLYAVTGGIISNCSAKGWRLWVDNDIEPFNFMVCMDKTCDILTAERLQLMRFDN